MANRLWRGDAPTVAQTSSVTITAYDVTTTYAITINGKTISTVGVGGSVSTTAVALLALLQASAIPEFAEIAWTNPSGGIITGTASSPGVPFTFTKSVSGGTGTMSAITTVAGSGPNDVAVAANWVGGVLPTTGDSVFFQDSNISALWNLDTFNGVVFALVSIEASYTGTIGLPLYHTASTITAGGYYEYRPTYFQQAATLINCNASGSGRIKLDNGTAQTTANFLGAGTSLETNVPTVLWKGTHASNVVSISAGTLGVAFFVGETATMATFSQAFQSFTPIDSVVTIGLGASLTTVNKIGGTLTTSCAITNLNVAFGTHTILAGAITTLKQSGGTIYPNGTGTITTATIGGGTLDFRQSANAMTITNMAVNPNSSVVMDSFGRVTFTNPPTDLTTGNDFKPFVIGPEP